MVFLNHLRELTEQQKKTPKIVKTIDREVTKGGFWSKIHDFWGPFFIDFYILFENGESVKQDARAPGLSHGRLCLIQTNWSERPGCFAERH